MAENYVQLRHVSKRFGAFAAVRDVSLSVPTGKLAALLGPSGSGKTTLLRMIAGLETPEEGDILIDGHVVNQVPGSQRGVGFLFQNYALFRYMTVYDNIAFGLRVKKAGREEIRQRVEELLELIDCKGLEKRYPRQLSGGQRQRVAFARALAPRPRLLLLDEPFAAVDAKVRQELRVWLRDMITQIGITSIFVTHDQDEALQVADEIIVTNQGRVEQAGPPRQLYERPETPFVARFVGQGVGIPDAGVFKSLPNAPAGTAAILRPEFITLAKPGERVPSGGGPERGTVEDVVFRGGVLEVKVRLDGPLLSARRPVSAPPLQIGEPVDVYFHRMLLLRDGQVSCLEWSGERPTDYFARG
ncbi:MAG: ABC transporter ATP-binding protein [Oscillospiraceae bacterium]|nr:ABC transporter ATP-binding protein [Oscillospiraceae bacterium]